MGEAEKHKADMPIIGKGGRNSGKLLQEKEEGALRPPESTVYFPVLALCTSNQPPLARLSHTAPLRARACALPTFRCSQKTKGEGGKVESLGNGVLQKKKRKKNGEREATVSSWCRHIRPPPLSRGRKGASSRTIRRRLFSFPSPCARTHVRTTTYPRERASAPLCVRVPASRSSSPSRLSRELQKLLARPVSQSHTRTDSPEEGGREEEGAAAAAAEAGGTIMGCGCCWCC